MRISGFMIFLMTFVNQYVCGEDVRPNLPRVVFESDRFRLTLRDVTTQLDGDTPAKYHLYISLTIEDKTTDHAIDSASINAGSLRGTTDTHGNVRLARWQSGTRKRRTRLIYHSISKISNCPRQNPMAISNLSHRKKMLKPFSLAGDRKPKSCVYVKFEPASARSRVLLRDTHPSSSVWLACTFALNAICVPYETLQRTYRFRV